MVIWIEYNPKAVSYSHMLANYALYNILGYDLGTDCGKGLSIYMKNLLNESVVCQVINEERYINI